MLSIRVTKFFSSTSVIKNGGLDTEDSYPYRGVDGTCKFDASKVGAKISSYVDVAHNDAAALQDALANKGPVSVAVC